MGYCWSVNLLECLHVQIRSYMVHFLYHAFSFSSSLIYLEFVFFFDLLKLVLNCLLLLQWSMNKNINCFFNFQKVCIIIFRTLKITLYFVIHVNYFFAFFNVKQKQCVFARLVQEMLTLQLGLAPGNHTLFFLVHLHVLLLQTFLTEVVLALLAVLESNLLGSAFGASLRRWWC